MKYTKPKQPTPMTPAERREAQRKEFDKRVDGEKRGRKR